MIFNRNRLNNIIIPVVDGIIIIIAFSLSLSLRFNWSVPDIWIYRLFNLLLPAVLINLTVFYLFGLYRGIWSYKKINDLLLTVGAVTIGIGGTYIYSIYSGVLPRSSFIFTGLFLFFYIIISRMDKPVVFILLDEIREKLNILINMDSAGKGRNLLLLIIIAAVIINILQFRAIDERAVNHFKALNRYDTGDIMEIGYRYSSRHRQRYSPALALGKLAPDSTVIIPTAKAYKYIAYNRSFGCDCSLHDCICMLEEFRVHLLTVGRAANVIQKTYSVQDLLNESNISDYFINSGSNSYLYLPWAIAMGSDSAKEFIYIQWKDSLEEHYDLLVDTSLLPVRIREELGL